MRITRSLIQPSHQRLSLCIALTLVAVVFTRVAQAQSGQFEIHGTIALNAQDAPAATSWLNGGVGRYLSDGDFEPSLQSQIGVHWSSGLAWEALLHLRADTRGNSGNDLGIVQVRLARHFFLANDARLSIALGQMFLPSSREAIDPLWQSRYTLNLSAVNSWIAEEVRPIGIHAALQSPAESEYPWELGVVGFGGNDTAGALLAWRGFALHDRLSVFNEHLPLPALSTLADGAAFAEQNNDGTRPFGRDLDGEPGFATYAHWGRTELFQLRGALVDNRGDRGLHRGEYAWDTRFALIGADWQVHPQLQLAAEWLNGRSGMGRRGGSAVVDIDFDAAYLLASWSPNETWRLSARWDRFDIQDRDHGPTENNSDHGNAATLSLMWTPISDWRFAAEWSATDSRHAAAADLGVNPETGGRSLRIEARYRF